MYGNIYIYIYIHMCGAIACSTGLLSCHTDVLPMKVAKLEPIFTNHVVYAEQEVLEDRVKNACRLHVRLRLRQHKEQHPRLESVLNSCEGYDRDTCLKPHASSLSIDLKHEFPEGCSCQRDVMPLRYRIICGILNFQDDVVANYTEHISARSMFKLLESYRLCR